MVSVAVSKMGMTIFKLIFVDPGMKVNGQYFCDVLLSQQMLPAMRHVCLSQDSAPTHRSMTPSCMQLLQREIIIVKVKIIATLYI